MCFSVFGVFRVPKMKKHAILIGATVSCAIFKSGWLTFSRFFAIMAPTKTKRKDISTMTETLGQRIIRLRTERGMSQGDLADTLDISRQSVSKWENEVSQT